MRTRVRDLLELPELNVAFFSLLHFVWEMWQAPLFEKMASTPHWFEALACSRATLGDATMAVVAFWVLLFPAGAARGLWRLAGRRC